jgi:uncharacterized Fe-S cluster-containing radical SAM superfamily protein
LQLPRGLVLSYDSLQRHLAIEKLVTRIGSKGLEKKYYRIRPARWYGGIVTADCVGCGLTCKFCWVPDAIMRRPTVVGRFYSAAEIADNLINLAKKRHFYLLRISGGEPTIGKAHLFKLFSMLQGKGYSFILETNGIFIAADESYAENISKHDFVHVRVSLKGCNEKEFAMLTGAKPDGFRLQLQALERLVDAGAHCHPSVMASFSPRQSLQELIQRLKQICSRLADELEIEELILYPHVKEKVKRYGLKYYTAYTPENVPPEQI